MAKLVTATAVQILRFAGPGTGGSNPPPLTHSNSPMKLTDKKVVEYLETRDLVLEKYEIARKRFIAAKEDLNTYNLFISEILGVKNMTDFGSEKFILNYTATDLCV